MNVRTVVWTITSDDRRELTWGKGLLLNNLDVFKGVVLDHGRHNPLSTGKFTTGTTPLFTAKQDLSTLLLGFFDGVQESLGSGFRVQGSDQCTFLFGCTHLGSGRGECLLERVEEGGGNRLVDEESTGRGASLTGCSESGKEDGSESQRLVGVREDNGSLRNAEKKT